GIPGHLVTIEDQAELDWIMANVAPTRSWMGLFQNVNSTSYVEPAGGYEWVTGEPFTFATWRPGRPNDTSSSGGSEEFVEIVASGTWNDVELAPSFVTQYLVEWDVMGTLGVNYCVANSNSTGGPAKIFASGSLVTSDNDLTLLATDLPPLGFGFFITSQTEGFAANPGGSAGNFCLGGSVGRYVGPGQIQNSGSLGRIELAIDLTQVPQPNGPVSVMAGETWSFQLWHRDSTVSGVPTSNFTDGVRLPFQ
ncbi:MAG: lectin-like protein, partial [Planctomycetota bacterium]